MNTALLLIIGKTTNYQWKHEISTRMNIVKAGSTKFVEIMKKLHPLCIAYGNEKGNNSLGKEVWHLVKI